MNHPGKFGAVAATGRQRIRIPPSGLESRPLRLSPKPFALATRCGLIRIILRPLSLTVRLIKIHRVMFDLHLTRWKQGICLRSIMPESSLTSGVMPTWLLLIATFTLMATGPLFEPGRRTRSMAYHNRLSILRGRSVCQ
jgi:hypothetical protein